MFKSKKLIGCLIGAALLCGAIAGCGGDDKKAAAPEKAAGGNTLVVYNCNTDDWTAPIVKEFQEKTGIKVELVAGGSGELMARVRAEKANPLGDVGWIGRFLRRIIRIFGILCKF